jgi:hypothetical protein
MNPPHIADNGILEAGSTLALRGLNRALYCKASPVNLDYKTLLNFEMTLLEMATVSSYARSSRPLSTPTNLPPCSIFRCHSCG